MKVTPVSPNIAVAKIADKETENTLEWMRKKMRRKESVEHFAHIQEENLADQAREASVFFADHKEKTDNTAKVNMLENLLINDNRTISKTGNNQSLLSSIANKLIQSYISEYLTFDELEVLWDTYLADEELKSEVKELLDLINQCESGEEVGVLNRFMGSHKLGVAQIYMILNYLMEKMRKRKEKELFLKDLERWTKRYSQQKSGYLFEFFSMVSQPELIKDLSCNNLDYLATINSSATDINGIKDTLQAISRGLNDQFNSLVSLYVKLKAHQLLWSRSAVNREDKLVIAQLVKMEKNLIIINSLYCRQQEYYKVLSEAGITCITLWEKVNKSEVLSTTIDFCESNFIIKSTIQKLFNSWGITDLTGNHFKKMLYHLSAFLRELPLALFKDKPEHKKELIAKMQDIRTKEYPSCAEISITSDDACPNFFGRKPQQKKFV